MLGKIIHWIDSCLSEWFELDHAWCKDLHTNNNSYDKEFSNEHSWVEEKDIKQKSLLKWNRYNRSAKNNDH